MRKSTLLLSSLALVLAASLALTGCGGKKRPPAVSGAGGATGRSTPSQVPDSGLGPDVSAVPGDTTSGAEFAVSNPETGEGGPLEDVHFEYDQASLTDQAKAILEKHATWLQTYRAARVTVEGHCDERGTVEYNLALGDRRARAARDYLLNLGVAAERLNAVSFGKERPLDPASNEEAWARNRRAHFVVTRP